MVSNNVAHHRCSACLSDEDHPLPPVNKRIVYLDQNAISEMAKATNPTTKGHSRVHEIWIKLYHRLARLVRLQVIVCPASEYHRRESRLTPQLQPVLERMYGHLADGISFDAPVRIEEEQLLDRVDAWITNDGERATSLRLDRVIRGDLTEWSDLLHLQASMAWPPEWTDTERDERHARHRRFVDRVFSWWASNPGHSFTDVFEHEVAAYGRTLVTDNIEYHLARPKISDPIQRLNLDHAPFMVLMKAVCAQLSRAGVPDEDVWSKATEFFGAPILRTVPFVRISCLLHAATARKAAAGQRRPPSTGYFTDVEAIAHLLPYCEAMFVDNEMRALLSEKPLPTAAGHPTRIFSRATMAQFFDFLDRIEGSVAASHVALVEQIYGPTRLSLPASPSGSPP